MDGSEMVNEEGEEGEGGSQNEKKLYKKQRQARSHSRPQLPSEMGFLGNLIKYFVFGISIYFISVFLFEILL